METYFYISLQSENTIGGLKYGTRITPSPHLSLYWCAGWSDQRIIPNPTAHPTNPMHPTYHPCYIN